MGRLVTHPSNARGEQREGPEDDPDRACEQGGTESEVLGDDRADARVGGAEAGSGAPAKSTVPAVSVVTWSTVTVPP